MQADKTENKPHLRNELGFLVIHLIPLLAIWTGATLFDWLLCAFLYFFRMFWITGGYHRYFAHRSYKTSRWFQWLIAFFAETSLQKGVLWWASHHRIHHRHSDTVEDPHSMKQFGFWHSHVGWIIGPDHKHTEENVIKDFSKYKEIRWISNHYLFPPIALAVIVFIIGGFVNTGGDLGLLTIGGIWYLQGAFSALLIGFFLSTAVLYHGTFSINSIMHKFGKPRYKTGDESKNSLILALVTLGEGWHNNHHYYQVAARNGFFWWEIDITYYILRTFAFFGLIWDLQGVPDKVKYNKWVHPEKLTPEQKQKSAG
jgi:stearoyl-CoA desaturase (delta-9 desaturase)